MRSKNARRSLVTVVAILSHGYAYGQECRVIPISSNPTADSIAGDEIQLTANSATITVEVECTGWGGGGADLEAYCFILTPICPALIWVAPELPECPQPELSNEECQTAADCDSGECTNNVCTPLYVSDAAGDWVFDGIPAIKAFDPSTDTFCAAVVDAPAADDGTFRHFAFGIIAVEGNCDEERDFEITLNDATFYLSDDTTATPAVQPAIVEIDPAPNPASATGTCGNCGSGLGLVLIPLFSVLSFWRARRWNRRAPNPGRD